MAPASPFFYATKQPGGNKTHRPPDTAARLRPTKQPVYFTTEQPGGDTYGYEVITEHEMDRLMNLWELREQTYRREGPYTDRVIEMLELASRAIWAKYGPDIMEYDSKVSQMRQAAEQIAAENYQRDIEREHHAERGEW